ncbi:sugar ABC transporter ATP-binding protein [Candidatus Epulonipiscium fishelsonii]|uniref:Sugar ABC transporter ATP-binding protein n=1 Tax=Candidatus Epulonipiscium fishelsonii TaxID=77094 RepID=A0ACC8XBM2_9FIRM|nr:sugar ABC transporter ATP-binding protein [Epulopiscium sp. SCG-B05WGA-EpuloA1]ONI40002.1 sugar ABC transporter ATP-binding protein [Epulopiscium sp. SCG-B11WGA-EpuloA1]ONI47607.1 sugar ABC transporter ATP-binding protein [Epulopiscium sp. SCG-C06WGA-EpuloA1]
MTSYKTKKSLSRAVVYLMLIIAAIIILIPFIWCLITALKSPQEIFTDTLFPSKLMWENFSIALTAIPFIQFFKNTMTILIPVLIGVLVSNSLVAFGFARLNIPHKNFWFTLLIATMMLPGQVTMIPQFIIYQQLGWVNTYLPLIVPAFFGSAFNIFLLRQFMMGIPKDLDEMAKIDGAGTFTIYAKIIMPLVKPAMTAIMIFTLTGVWNDYQGPLIYVSDVDKFTMAIGLSLFKGEYSVEWNMLMAATIIMILPIIIIFFVAQRYFIEGITVTGLKG